MKAAGPATRRTSRLIRSWCYAKHRALLWAVKRHHVRLLQQELQQQQKGAGRSAGGKACHGGQSQTKVDPPEVAAA
eukprot:CAMPEP_0172687076 /NCGR_PEP_ID=MMETSP1074-20121228/21413_1 /TAXON_ID=2916 /ORGANISM="Ceratium fusus, Strain PA161109" /LENGTH=75 /DNA_ID=CAMNT_0013506487 /DNA_START=618 /DNA_END=841 /DNA_ORIENTATION=+